MTLDGIVDGCTFKTFPAGGIYMHVDLWGLYGVKFYDKFLGRQSVAEPIFAYLIVDPYLRYIGLGADRVPIH